MCGHSLGAGVATMLGLVNPEFHSDDNVTNAKLLFRCGQIRRHVGRCKLVASPLIVVYPFTALRLRTHLFLSSRCPSQLMLYQINN